MSARLCALLVVFASTSAFSGSWRFDTPIDLGAITGPGVFHHLESSGRRSLAVSRDRVAIVWEDEHQGMPRVYVAIKKFEEKGFASEVLALSGSGEAFEPTLVALPDDRFAVAWEEDEVVRLRLFRPTPTGSVELGAPIDLSAAPSGQPSLALAGKQLLAVWAQQQGRARQIRFARIAHPNGARASLTATVIETCAVEPNAPPADQLYPTVLAVAERALVAWEDRRPGHTVIMASSAPAVAGCRFRPPGRISVRPPRPKAPYGKGHGVARVVLAGFGADRALAAWEDKRDFRHGYDIYGAELGADGLFGANVRIQDDFGELSQQRHTALAGDATGRLVAAWDDTREGNADLALSWREDGQWSDDLIVPVASGPGEQQHPTIALDGDGRLHMAWTERPSIGAATRLRYTTARFVDD